MIGCIDGTHTPIKQPNENAHDYFCYKMKYTINAQAICDHEEIFLEDCSWLGNVHDAKTFANSEVNKMVRNKSLPSVERQFDNGNIAVPPLLIGDPAYPLLPYVMKEYGTCNCNEEVMFNVMLRSVRNQI